MDYFKEASSSEVKSYVDELNKKYKKFINYLRSHDLYNEFFDNLTRDYETGETYYESGYDSVGVTDVPTETPFSWKISYKYKVIDEGHGWYTDYSSGFHSGESSTKKYTEEKLYKHLRDRLYHGAYFYQIDEIIEKCLKALDVSIEDYYNKQKEEPSKFKEVKEEVKEEKNSKKEQIKKFLENIKELLSNHDIKEEDMYGSVEVDESVLITTIEDHREFRPEFLPYIKFIDLSKISCKNLKVSGLDLRNTNIKLNPSQVYNKDLSNTLLSTSVLSRIFQGCNFEGCIISDFVETSELTENNQKKM